MRLIPAIDLLDGKVVRLRQGNYDEVLSYEQSPEKTAQIFSEQGFQLIHVIDLCGAKEGSPNNLASIQDIIKKNCKLQVGGGIRTVETADAYFSLGVERIIVSTAAIMDPAFWETLVQKYTKEKIVLSLDIKDNLIAIKGWKEQSPFTLDQVIERIKLTNLHHLIVTDTSRDGTLQGPNFALYKEIRAKYPDLNLIPAGGISSLQDIKEFEKLGIKEVIMGRAIYENPTLLSEVRDFTMLYKIDWEKVQGLVPAVVQSVDDGQVLMLGYMDKEAFKKTVATKNVTFFSRTRQTIWTKGETSGNLLHVSSLHLDCDHDTLLIKAKPTGPVCHLGTPNCFGDKSKYYFLEHLQRIIDQRLNGKDENSYVYKLSKKGAARVAQKVGEEGLETALASLQNSKADLMEESADLLFHFLVNLRFHHIDLSEIIEILQKRNKE